MRKALVVVLGVCLLALFVGSVSARDIDRNGKRIMKALSDDENPALIDQGVRGLMTSAAVDTYWLAWFDFEQMNWQGFTVVDNTAQVGTFFHVDDFVGLGGGSYGNLYAPEGDQAMWCGARPGSDFYMCSWGAAPGYGNSWNQLLSSSAIPFSGILTWTYKAHYDSEPDYDITYIEYDAGDDNWTEIASFDNWDVDTVVTHQLLLTQAATKLRYHFVADAAWSDQDGLWDTDGAFIVDSITVSDAGGLIDYENFETATVGDLAAGIWTAGGAEAFGSYTGLANSLVDKDPCGDNFGTQIVFFDGSPYPSADYSGLFDTPFCSGPGGIEAPCQSVNVVSPVIDATKYSTNRDEVQDATIPNTSTLGGCAIRFTVYRDLPVDNLVFYTWGVRNIDETGCPGIWKNRNYVYYGGDKDYIPTGADISDLITSDLPIQVTIGVQDMCDAWYSSFGTCAAHTPSPWLDNLAVYRYETVGPQWSWRNLDIFNDTWPTDLSIESWCRADAANDLSGNEDPIIRPGDSIVVDCSGPLSPLDTLVDGQARVYCHVNTEYIGTGTKPDLFGPTLVGTYGTYVSDDGNWTILHCPQALTGAGNPVLNRYMVDLNDSLFTRGYMIEYYFKAYDRAGNSSTLPRYAEDPNGFRFEFTCLPTLASSALFVNDSQGPVETYFDPALDAVSPEPVDRYFVNNASSAVSNGVGAYADPEHVKQVYEKIIYDAGGHHFVTISEGTEYSDKSNDANLFVEFLKNSEHKVGLWVFGDGVAYDLDGSTSAVALELMSTICGVALVNDSYYDLTGGREAGGVAGPLITGVSGTLFSGFEYYADGGCPGIPRFDVIEKTGPGAYCLQYPDFNSLQYYAGIYTDQTNNFGYPMRTVWIGHSNYWVESTSLGIPARNRMVDAVFKFFENPVNTDITGDQTPMAFGLAQNFPNPFNPSTRISFTLPARSRVSLRIYNVAGRLVKTLADGAMDAGSHELTWDGTDNLGAGVASGVYFYTINAGNGYESTKKMVILR
ncbi:MAG: FlgD immunoglobulin-like domain containing protein [Candidatus Krumholzibacteria bacterium]|nr:FlgD immunoglobulin-like domain containing protein [Candidatus Krumholzibacteria bacterium]